MGVAEGKTWFFRTALFIGLISVVATIIYLTPVPDHFPQSCSRPCHELDWPMICRVKLVVEPYQSLSHACGGCPANISDCYTKHCVTAGGFREAILAVNRQFPGPNFQVCQNDIIVVDVVNRIPGHSFGIHWRGQLQYMSPFMDGVPMVTQCPIPSFTTFQYRFTAHHAGTHMWQANTGEELLATLFGGFIVRQPDSKNPQRSLYDTDEHSHVVTVHAWNSRHRQGRENGEASVQLLINGKIQAGDFPPAVFHVVPGKRHRFRLLYGGQANSCRVIVSVEEHQLLVIALDGHPITPKLVTSIRISQGERVDFVLRADQSTSSQYTLHVTPESGCDSVSSAAAVVQYKGNVVSIPQPLPQPNRHPAYTELSTSSSEADCTSTDSSKSRICMNSISGLEPLPPELSAEHPDKRFYFFFGYSTVSSNNLSNTTFIAINNQVRIATVNNLTMMLPSSPLLSQSGDVSSDMLCSRHSTPTRCKTSSTGNICECTHVVDIPMAAVLDLVLVNQESSSGQVLHLHGHKFYVLGVSQLDSVSPEDVLRSDKEGTLLARNLKAPVLKDTVYVPESGVAVVRIRANNPGYWLLSQLVNTHWTRGMSVILHVGSYSDLPDAPYDFPKCGDWRGPEFFLA